jgi:hypothetical protein
MMCAALYTLLFQLSITNTHDRGNRPHSPLSFSFDFNYVAKQQSPCLMNAISVQEVHYDRTHSSCMQQQLNINSA